MQPSCSSEQGRLTAEQSVVLQNMSKVFGEGPEEIGRISYLFCTFADSKRVPVLNTVKEAGLKFKNDYPVNSSSYFAMESVEGSSSEDDYESRDKRKKESINELLWKMTTESVKIFLEDIENNSPIHVYKSRPQRGPNSFAICSVHMYFRNFSPYRMWMDFRWRRSTFAAEGEKYSTPSRHFTSTRCQLQLQLVGSHLAPHILSVHCGVREDTHPCLVGIILPPSFNNA